MRALLSVANRDGLSAFARELLSIGVELVATDGTREHLAADGIEAASVSDLTAAPPLVGGQVRTFHPQIYAGILARRDRDEPAAQRGGTEQRPEDDRGDRQRGERDGRFHGRSL